MDIKRGWALDKLFYRGLKDPRIKRDVALGEQAVDAFVKKYSIHKTWLREPKALFQALKDYESLILKNNPAPIMYAHYRKELNAKDKEAEAVMNQLDQVYTKRGNRLLFFELQLGKVSASAQKKFLAAKELAPFKYYLERLFKNAKHNLSEPEERILSLLSDVSHGRWVQAIDNILSTREIRFKGKKMPLNKALEEVSGLPMTRRRALHKAVMAEFKAIADMAESELNAIVTRKKITDELRGFKEPYDATILGYENDRKSVLALVEAVTRNFHLAQRFYKLKARMLKQEHLTYADRAASVGKIEKKVTFTQAAALVRKVLKELDPKYAAIFDRLLKGGQVDVYPKLGKTSGAYCSGQVGQPTLLLLNHTDTVKSLLTLAHEMGHAIHTERSKKERPMYQGYTISVAEVASTFFEQVVAEALQQTLSAGEQVIALHDKIQDDIQTVFRQIAFFNFEVDLHKGVRTRGLLPKEEIAKLLNKHMESYLGDAVKLTDDDGYFFVTVGHFRRFFYVYSYAFGQLVSRALFERVQKDKKFIKKVDEFLVAGGRMSPEEIFKKCGLNLYTPAVFLEGLKGIEKDLKKLESLL